MKLMRLIGTLNVCKDLLERVKKWDQIYMDTLAYFFQIKFQTLKKVKILKLNT